MPQLLTRLRGHGPPLRKENHRGRMIPIMEELELAAEGDDYSLSSACSGHTSAATLFEQGSQTPTWNPEPPHSAVMLPTHSACSSTPEGIKEGSR